MDGTKCTKLTLIQWFLLRKIKTCYIITQKLLPKDVTRNVKKYICISFMLNFDWTATDQTLAMHTKSLFISLAEFVYENRKVIEKQGWKWSVEHVCDNSSHLWRSSCSIGTIVSIQTYQATQCSAAKHQHGPKVGSCRGSPGRNWSVDWERARSVGRRWTGCRPWSTSTGRTSHSCTACSSAAAAADDSRHPLTLARQYHRIVLPTSPATQWRHDLLAATRRPWRHTMTSS